MISKSARMQKARLDKIKKDDLALSVDAVKSTPPVKEDGGDLGSAFKKISVGKTTTKVRLGKSNTKTRTTTKVRLGKTKTPTNKK